MKLGISLKRLARVLFEMIGPPLIAALVLTATAGPGRHGATDEIAETLLWAYLLGGIPSIVFAIIMEIHFAVGSPQGGWGTLALASGLGLMAGVVLAMPVIGLLTGAIMGSILWLVALIGGPRREPDSHRPSDKP